jgi:uncharacterized membrane protein
MNRIYLLDNLRGIAFLFMVLQHIFYFYDVSNNYQTKTASNKLVDYSGIIARTLFVLLAGYSVYMAYKKDINNKKDNKNNYIQKRITRSFEICIHALLITGVTYLLYPQYFIRFGILHFIALGTFIITLLAPYKKLTLLFLIFTILFKYPKINNVIDTITGASVNYNMMDYFPLNKWLPVLTLGLVIGQHIDISKIQIPMAENKFLSYLGKNSLNLYTLHVIILLVFYKYIKNIKK